MKVLIDHQLPFLLAHGGLQIQIEQTKAALENIGIEVEYLRFWDAEQRADVIHVFGRCSKGYIELAQRKGIAVVMSELLSETGSRSRRGIIAQKAVIRTARQLLPSGFLSRMGWESFRAADAVVALTPWEAQLMIDLFDADKERLHVVPNGVEECFFTAAPMASREDWLVSTVTIAPRKRAVELAQAASAGRVKIRIIGKPYSEQDPYYRRFLEICQASANYVSFRGAVSDRTELARIYSAARGFVLFSTFESLSLSALEASAAGCPLFLTDLPWARATFGDNATYCPVKATPERAGQMLQQFAKKTGSQPKAPTPLRWTDVAKQLLSIYTAASERLRCN